MLYFSVTICHFALKTYYFPLLSPNFPFKWLREKGNSATIFYFSRDSKGNNAVFTLNPVDSYCFAPKTKAILLFQPNLLLFARVNKEYPMSFASLSPFLFTDRCILNPKESFQKKRIRVWFRVRFIQTHMCGVKLIYTVRFAHSLFYILNPQEILKRSVRTREMKLFSPIREADVHFPTLTRVNQRNPKHFTSD